MELGDIVMELYLRYRKLESKHSKLIEKMFKRMLEKAKDWPVDKTNRWIGFIQGILFVEGLITIDEERDFTRPLFHSYYKSCGISIPESEDVGRFRLR